MWDAMFHSLLIAKLFGLYLVLMAIIMSARATYYRQWVQNLSDKDSGITMAASFGMLLGLFMILVHHFWVWEPRVLVTILVWIILVKSVMWLGFPEMMLRLTKKVYASPAYWLIMLIMAIYGIVLTADGFHLQQIAVHPGDVF